MRAGFFKIRSPRFAYETTSNIFPVAFFSLVRETLNYFCNLNSNQLLAKHIPEIIDFWFFRFWFFSVFDSIFVRFLSRLFINLFTSRAKCNVFIAYTLVPRILYLIVQGPNRSSPLEIVESKLICFQTLIKTQFNKPKQWIHIILGENNTNKWPKYSQSLVLNLMVLAKSLL